MRSELVSPAGFELSLRDPLVRATVQRIPGMLAVWLGFGVITGVATAPGVGPIAVAAGITAGIIVLTPFGLFLALVGGRWMASLAAGLLGMVLVPSIVRVADLSPGVSLVPLGLVFGGIAGATVVTACYRLPRLLMTLGRAQLAQATSLKSP